MTVRQRRKTGPRCCEFKAELVNSSQKAGAMMKDGASRGAALTPKHVTGSVTPSAAFARADFSPI